MPVVLFHAGVPIAKGGYIGVDVFFVVSGFLITSIIVRELEKSEFSLLRFYERRARRILPALLFMVAVTLIAGTFLLLPNALSRLGESVIATALFGSNFYFWRSLDYFSLAAEYAPMLHTWSLAVEEQFYIFFPLLLMAIYALSLRKWLRTLLVVMTLGSLGLAIVAVELRPLGAFYLLPFRAWELGLGAMLATFSLTAVRSSALREGLTMIGLIGILAPVFFYTPTTPFPGLAAVPPVVGTAILIGLGSQRNMVAKLLSTKPFVAVGLISYSLYLWHWPILALMRANKLSPKLSLTESAFAIMLSFALAWISYEFIEKPVRKHKIFKDRRQILTMSAVSLSAFAVVGAALHLTKGLPQRLPADALRAEASMGDINPYRTSCMGRTPDAGLCVIGDGLDSFVTSGSSSDILVWGDSHADAMMPAIERAADKLGLRAAFATSSACPPVYGVEITRGAVKIECKTFNDAILRHLASTENYSTVVLHARWSLYAEGRYGEEAGDDVILHGSSTLYPNDGAPNRNLALLQLSLDQTVEAIRATGRDVIVLGPTPEVGWDVPTRIAMMHWRDEQERSPPNLKAVTARTDRIVSILKSVAAAHQAHYVDLIEPICATECVLRVGDDLAYSDDDHLSATAVRELMSPVMREALSRVSK